MAPENERFVFLLWKILPGLCDGYGGFNYDAISFVLDRYGVPEGQQPIIIDRCLVIINAIQEIREEEREK